MPAAPIAPLTTVGAPMAAAVAGVPGVAAPVVGSRIVVLQVRVVELVPRACALLIKVEVVVCQQVRLPGNTHCVLVCLRV